MFFLTSEPEKFAWGLTFLVAIVLLSVAFNWSRDYKDGDYTDAERVVLTAMIAAFFMLYAGVMCVPIVRERNASWFVLGCTGVAISSYIANFMMGNM